MPVVNRSGAAEKVDILLALGIGKNRALRLFKNGGKASAIGPYLRLIFLKNITVHRLFPHPL